ncbi:MAG: FMN-binding protein [Sedimentisphaerales bacterium]|nr:FMN-binding protein [Sedimentisphaerales bacterium]
MKVQYTSIILLALICFNVEILAKSDSKKDKTKAEIDALIENVGGTAPDWWDSVEFRIPETLDMNWPVRIAVQQGFGGRGGRNQFGGRGGRGGFRNMGGRGNFGVQQAATSNLDNSRSIDNFLVQVIYPNDSRYKTGIKLINHLMILHKDDTQKLARSLSTLGDMFYNLLEDYARAAFWWQKASQMSGSVDTLKLARCYYELGSKSAAYEFLTTSNSGYRGNNKDTIKFWANIGEVDMALEMIESNSQTNMNMGGRFSRGSSQGVDYMFAAEICRMAGRYEQAAVYYEKIINSISNNFSNFRSRGGSSSDRAKANMEVVKLLHNLDLKQIPDGTYTSNAVGYGGTLYVNVTVARKRIVSVEVTQHRETYSYFSRAIQTARKIVSKQDFKGVDIISGATITSDAIINAAAKALASAAE